MSSPFFVAGPLLPTTAVDGGGPDAVWASPANVKSYDSVLSTASVSAGQGTNALVTSNYSFHIPPSAIIDGIYVVMSYSGVQVITSNISIFSGAKVASKSPSDLWPSTATTVEYGSGNDTWGTSWTPSDINSSTFGFSITAHNTHGGGTASIDVIEIFVQWHYSPQEVRKRYNARTYAKDGTYLGDLPEFVDFGYTYDINTAGSQVTLNVPLDIDTAPVPAVQALTDESGNIWTDEAGQALTTEGMQSQVAIQGASNTLIKNGNAIVVREYSYYYPDGHIVFRGMIERWTATFGSGGDSEMVQILAYSDGADMDNSLLYGPPLAYTLDQSQTVHTTDDMVFLNNSDRAFSYSYAGQTFIIGAGINNIGAVSLLLNGTATVTVSLYSSPGSTTVLNSASVNVNTTGSQEIQFQFPYPWYVISGSSLFFAITVGANQSILVGYNNADSYASGTTYVANYSGTGGGGYLAASVDLYFKTFSSSGQTTATYSSMDPTVMLEEFVANYANSGGKISYDATTIDLTGLSLSYTFTTATVYEGLRTVLTLAPDGFYYYVDIASDLLYFKNSSTTADVLLTRGIHLEKLQIGATIENVKNSVYFSGGVPAGGTTNLYKHYSDATSIANYGQRLDRKSDNRVTLSATADAIGLSEIAELKDEAYETIVVIPDRTMDTSALRPGQIVGFRGFGTFVDNLLMQIVNLKYTPIETTLTLGIMPKRTIAEFDSITRGLIAQQTVNNPSTPS